MDKRFIFVCGVGRSGTTALVKLLNSHPRIALGNERYRLRQAHLRRELFEPERFFDFQEGDTSILPNNPRNQTIYERLHAKWDQATHVGDKIPHLFTRYAAVDREFSPLFLYIQRDIEAVASSWNVRAENPADSWPEQNDYTAAVEWWNRGAAATLAFAQSGGNVCAVDYRALFSRDHDYLSGLLARIGVADHPHLRKAYDHATEGWEVRAAKPRNERPGQAEFIQQRADRETATRLMEDCGL